jgi:hypothetical protein
VLIRVLALFLLLASAPGLAAECRYDWECRVTTFPECRPDGCSPPCGIHPTGIAAVPYGGIQDFQRTMQEEAARRCPSTLACQKCAGELTLPDASKYHARCEKGACRLAAGPGTRRTDRSCERDSDCVLNWTGCCSFELVGRKQQKAPSAAANCRVACEGEKEPPSRLACVANQCVPDGVRAPQPRSEPTSRIAAPPAGTKPPAVALDEVPQPGAVGTCIHRVKPNVFQVVVRDAKGALVTDASVGAQMKKGRRYVLDGLGNGFYVGRDLPEGTYDVSVRWVTKVKLRKGIERRKRVYGGCPSTEGIEPATIEVKLD